MTDDPTPDAALHRRLRDAPGAAERLAGLRRAAYGRDGSHDGAAEALLAEEARLVDEGRRMLADESEARTEPTPGPPTPAEPAPGPPTPDPPTPRRAPLTRTTRDRAPLAHARRLLRPGPVAAAAVAICVVAGLGSASASGLLSDDDSWRNQEPTSTPGPPSTPDPRIGQPVPAFTAEPPDPFTEQLTAAQTAEALREQGDALWRNTASTSPGAVRPDVATERVIPDADWLAQHAACLREAGVDVTLIGTGPDQRLSDAEIDPVVDYSCSVRFPRAPAGPLTDPALAYLHDYFVSFLIPCYASEGEPYEDEVPDRATFVARARSGDWWQPTPSSDHRMLESLCPSAPARLP
ncbi:hypothetical protein [Clavibacter sp. km1a]|uniref:hypothetical protein n=1 Tax=Clavibacter sp. km1a TaxID=3459136 RepID=UPI00404304A4